MVNCAKSIIASLPERRRHKPLHFAELDHSQRVMAINTMGKAMVNIFIKAFINILPVSVKPRLTR